MEDIAHHGIQIFRPTLSENDDAETMTEIREVIDRFPFAIIGSSREVDVNGRRVRGRKYPWGVIEGDLLNIF